jgi:hypothetical protein
MDCKTFESRLRTAAQHAVRFARRYVRETLPDDIVFIVYPNQSYDEDPEPPGDEILYPGDSLPEGQYHGPCSLERVVTFLWRDGRVPEWINVAVNDENDCHTIVALGCCGRFTADAGLLYYRSSDVSPFVVKSPVLPWHSGYLDATGRFSLHWQRRDRRTRSQTLYARAHEISTRELPIFGLSHALLGVLKLAKSRLATQGSETRRKADRVSAARERAT